MSDPASPVFAGGFEEFVIQGEAARGGVYAFRYTQVSGSRFSDFDGTATLLICIG